MIGFSLFSPPTLFPPTGKGPAKHALFAQASDVPRDVTGTAFEAHKRLDILGLVINFKELKRTDGISGWIIPRSNLN
jgi:hypothetical protein